jgi:hypothetical protein
MISRKPNFFGPCLTASVSAIAIAGLIVPVGHAQEESTTAEASSRRLGTVTVVAQKKEESIQDVPIAISAFGDEALDRAQIEDAELELAGLRIRRANLERAPREPERLVAPVSGAIAAVQAVAGQIADWVG